MGLWRWTAEANPNLEATERRRLIEDLTSPLGDVSVASPVKALLAGRLFQVLLLGHAGSL